MQTSAGLKQHPCTKLVLNEGSENSLAKGVDILVITSETLSEYMSDVGNQGFFSEQQKKWITQNGFQAKPNEVLLIPSDDGGMNCVLWGQASLWHEGALKDCGSGFLSLNLLVPLLQALPEGMYKLKAASQDISESFALLWALAQYDFSRYKNVAISNSGSIENIDALQTAIPKEERSLQKGKKSLQLSMDVAAFDHLMQKINTICLGQDLINTPTQDMGPADFENIARGASEYLQASVTTVQGEELIEKGFPAIYHVGKAAHSSRSPRILEINWGQKHHKKISLVGKGVCFDTGGLNIKGDQNMRLMKKDMGGAAHALVLGLLIMQKKLPVNLQILLPLVENAIDGQAMRPGDILPSRKGLTIEVGHTDAEGRLILCDALAYACEKKPELLIDFATLTGAARVALGPDLPAVMTNDEGLWQKLERAGQNENDPLWRLPLWPAYQDGLKSPIADICNISSAPGAGAITAGLFLQNFVEDGLKWAHFDVFGWRFKPKAMANIQAVLACLSMIESEL